MSTDYIDAFRTVIEEAGLRTGTIIADGKLHRCGTVGKEHGSDGSYRLYPDPPISGCYWNFRTGETASWSAGETETLSTEGRARIREVQEVRRQFENAHAAVARAQVFRIMETSQPAPTDHPYLLRKGVKPHGVIRILRDGRLALPIHNALGSLQSVQFLSDKGEKRFLTGGKVRGGFFPISGDDGSIYIVEGYATGATIHEATGGMVLVAFTCSNLSTVAAIARAASSDGRIVICADNDHETAAKHGENPGIRHATAAAIATQSLLAIPQFKDPAGKTDFNDLAMAEGLEVVRSRLNAAAPPPSSPTDANAAKSSLVALSAHDFLNYQFPKRGYILDPILPGQGLALLYAPRGLGKTYFALTIACGVSLGTPVFRWETGKPRKVLFVDGEMSGGMLQERLAGILNGLGKMPTDTLQIVTPDCQPDFIPNLATSEGQTALEPMLTGVELLIIDNLATLCRVGKENESESWLPIQTWLLTLRRRGIAVILIHHANKSGGQRGTSSREDVMDSVIALRPTKDRTPKDTARFEVHLEKSRGIAGSAIEPFEATLVATDDTYHWTMRGLECAAVEMVAQLHAAGMSVREIEKITGISKTQVHRMTEALSQKMAPRRQSSGRRVPASQS